MKMQTWLIFLISVCTAWEQWRVYLLLLFFQLFLTLWPHRLQHNRFPCPSLSPELAQMHVHWVGDATQPSPSLSSLLLLPSILFSIRIFSKESGLHIRCQRMRAFNLSISTANEYSETISFRIDWLDLLEVQGTLKSFFQHHNSKASVLQHSASLPSSPQIRSWLLKKP